MREYVKTVEFAILDENRIQSLWDVYDKGFAAANEIEIQRCYTAETFPDTMRDPNIAKFIVQHPVDGVLALAIGTNDLQKATVAYVNPQRLADAFPDLVREGRLWYITTLVVTPEAQKLGIGALLVESITEFSSQNRSSIAFDYAFDPNGAGDGFAQFVLTNSRAAVTRLGLSIERLRHIPFGGQHYCAIINDPKE